MLVHVVSAEAIANSLLMLIVPRFSAVFPVFVKVTVFAVLVVPSLWFEKVSLVVLKLTGS